MEAFNFCWISLLEEAKKNGFTFDKNTCDSKVSKEYPNFDKVSNRLSYMYTHGSFEIQFFQKCICKCISEVPSALKLIEDCFLTKNLNVCSVSAGPPTDIIGLFYSLHLLGKPLKEPVAVKIVNKYSAWRSLTNSMINSQITNLPDASTCKLIECDVLQGLSSKAVNYFKSADVLLMCRTFNSFKGNKSMITQTLKDTLQLLKTGAIVFFISEKEKSVYIKEIETFGHFLYGPSEITAQNLPYNTAISDLTGVKPLCSGNAYFAVFVKLPQNNEKTNEGNPKKIASVNLAKTKNKELKAEIFGNAKVQVSHAQMALKNTENITYKDGSLESQGNTKNKSTAINVDNRSSSINVFLKSVESLVSSLEDFVQSNMSKSTTTEDSNIKFHNSPSITCENFHHCLNSCCSSKSSVLEVSKIAYTCDSRVTSPCNRSKHKNITSQHIPYFALPLQKVCKCTLPQPASNCICSTDDR